MFAKRLRELRSAKGMMQKELAKDLNVTYGAIGMWETGKREPDYETAKQLAQYFNVSTDYLLGNTDDPTPPNAEPKPLGTDYIFIAGKNGIRRKFPVPAEKLERFKKLVEAGLPELLDDEDL